MFGGTDRTSLFSGVTVTSGERNKSTSGVGTKSIRSSKKTKQYKKLSYNPREISSQLMRASKARSASEVLCRAKARVGILKQCQGSGQYDLNEVRAAIAHASRMVDCASMKVRHLKEEEAEQRRNRRSSGSNTKKLRQEAKRRQTKAGLRIKKIRLEQKQAAHKREMEMKQLRLEQKRRMHRSKEYGKINEAEMLYIKRRGREEHRADTGGVLLELSSTAAQLSSLERDAQSLKQMKRQAEQELAAEGQQAGAQAEPSGGTVSGGSAQGGADAVQETVLSGGSGGGVVMAASVVDVSV